MRQGKTISVQAETSRQKRFLQQMEPKA